MSVISKVESLATLDNIQFLFHVNESSTLQLINGISSDRQKLLKYCNGTAIFVCSSVMHVLNGAQFLNAPFVSLLPEVIFPTTKIYASE